MVVVAIAVVVIDVVAFITLAQSRTPTPDFS